jgi:hypothetical protein
MLDMRLREDLMRLRSLKFVFMIGVCVFGLNMLARAGQNQFGVADSHNINFSTPMRVGDVLLPQGEYRVLHTMEGQEHVMLFKQLNTTKKPAEARVKCQLVTLATRAQRDEQAYAINASNEHVLHALTFRGDSAQHVF